MRCLAVVDVMYGTWNTQADFRVWYVKGGLPTNLSVKNAPNQGEKQLPTNIPNIATYNPIAKQFVNTSHTSFQGQAQFDRNNSLSGFEQRARENSYGRDRGKPRCQFCGIMDHMAATCRQRFDKNVVTSQSTGNTAKPSPILLSVICLNS